MNVILLKKGICMMKSKIVASLALSLSLTIGSGVPLSSFNTVEAKSLDNTQVAVQQMIQNRIERGVEGFDSLQPGKTYKMKDAYEKNSKVLVELVDQSSSIKGYMVVDTEANNQVIEYSLNDTHPLLAAGNQNNVFYLGATSYSEDIGNGKMKDLKTKLIYDKNNLEKAKSALNNVTTEEESGFTTQAITNYYYKVISGVPDYQQNNNDNMDNDCVPTSGANVMMYWDSHGYSNMTTGTWITVANRLGAIMGHTDSGGVSRDRIISGLKTFLSERGYGSKFTVDRDYYPSFADITAQINSNNPLMMSVNSWMGQNGGHNITAVGAEEYYDTNNFTWYRSVIVHDNWESTGTNVWVSFSSAGIDDLYKVANN